LSDFAMVYAFNDDIMLLVYSLLIVS